MRKLLVVVGGGILQEKTFEEASRRGLKTLLIDGDENCHCRSLTDYFICNSTKFLGSNVAKVEKFLSDNKDLKIVGAYTQGTDTALTVAAIVCAFRLPGIDFDTALLTHNKIKMRQAFARDGIRQPTFVPNSTAWLKLPVVVKSVDNCASRGVTVVRDNKDFQQAVEIAKKHSTDGEYIVEEFIDGHEYSVDTIVYKGVVYPCGISDRVFLKKDTYAIQDGSVTPSFLPEEIQEEMYQIMQDCANSLGVKQGAFKGDLIVKDGKVYVLEVTARLSGGFDSQYRKPYSYGVNLIKATMDLALGLPLDFSDIIPRWVKFSQTFSIFPKPGVITGIWGLHELKQIPGIRKVFFTKHVGQLVEYKTCADRVVHIIACADTYEELQRIIKEARETLRIETE